MLRCIQSNFFLFLGYSQWQDEVDEFEDEEKKHIEEVLHKVEARQAPFVIKTPPANISSYQAEWSEDKSKMEENLEKLHKISEEEVETDEFQKIHDLIDAVKRLEREISQEDIEQVDA